MIYVRFKILGFQRFLKIPPSYFKFFTKMIAIEGCFGASRNIVFEQVKHHFQKDDVLQFPKLWIFKMLRGVKIIYVKNELFFFLYVLKYFGNK